MTTTHIMSDETGQQILAQLTAISQALDDGALTNQQISTVLSDGTPTGAGFLDGGGLKTFFDGLKTKFAAIVHNHSGDALTPASVTATGKVKAATIEDSGGTLAALRESVSSIGSITASNTTEFLKKLGQWYVTNLKPYQSKASHVAHDGQWQGFTTGCVLSNGTIASYIVFNSEDAYLCYYVASSDSCRIKKISFV